MQLHGRTALIVIDVQKGEVEPEHMGIPIMAGGAERHLCVYGVEGPGGYQLVGRTVPVWDTADTPPWQLRHFDQLRFHLVSEDALEELRRASVAGRWAPTTEPVTFSLAEHARFLVEHGPSIAAFRARREQAFEAERQAWAAPVAAGRP